MRWRGWLTYGVRYAFTGLLITLGTLSVDGVGQERTHTTHDDGVSVATHAEFPVASICSSLRTVLTQMRRYAAGGVVPRAGTMADFSNPLVRVGLAGEVQTYLHVSAYGEAERAVLQDHGVDVELVDATHGMVQAWIPFWQVEAVARLGFVRRMTAPSYATPRIGSVTTQGDMILNAAALRALGFRGSGVKVGVISAGIEGLNTAQSTCDLPANITEVGPSGFRNGEGTAMLEIIHDLAPEAELAFCGPRTSLEMVQCVERLVNNFGADILVDDLGFYDEPYFEDGPVAMAVADAVAQGVIYASAAGNDALVHYEANFVGFDAGPDGMLHDFGVAAGGPSDRTMDLTLAAGADVTIVLQWNDPFHASDNNYDLILRDQSENTDLAQGTDVQDGVGGDDPVETLTFFNASASPRRLKVVVRLVAGDPMRRLEMFFLVPFTNNVMLEEYGVPAGSIFGHPAVVGVLATGALHASNPMIINPLTSHGPAQIIFPVPETRQKPDITATDGVSVSGAGGFPSPFFGTSAAAPHVAGIAALLKSVAPAATAEAIGDAIRNSAEDIGIQGTDSITGAGLIDALAAAALLGGPTSNNNNGNGVGDAVTVGANASGVCSTSNNDNGGGGGGGCLLCAGSGFDDTLLGVLVLGVGYLSWWRWRQRRMG